MNNEQEKIIEKMIKTTCEKILKEFNHILAVAQKTKFEGKQKDELFLFLVGGIFGAANKQIIHAIMEAVNPKTFAVEFVDYLINDLTKEADKLKNKFLN